MTDLTHPFEFELADYLDGTLSPEAANRVQMHLQACPSCAAQVALGQGGAVATVPDPARTATLPTVPALTLTAVRQRRVSPPTPGQVWRLRVPDGNRELTALAVLVQVDPDGDLVVAPATSDPRTATDLWTAQLPVLSGGVELAVWVSLETSIGWEALDVHVDDVDAATVDRLHTALRRREQPPRDLTLGLVPDDAVRTARRALRALYDQIAAARLVEIEDADEAVPLANVIEERQLSLEHVAKLVPDLTAGQVFATIKNKASLSTDQLNILSAELGVRLAGSSGGRPWAREVARPTYRQEFEDIAAAAGVDGWERRRRSAHELVRARGNDESPHALAVLMRHHLDALRAAAGLPPTSP